MDNKNASVIKKALSLALAVATAFTMVACRSQTTHEPPSITQAPDTTVSENAVNENTTITTTVPTTVDTTTVTTTTESTTTEATTTTTTPTTEKEVTTTVKKETLEDIISNYLKLPKGTEVKKIIFLVNAKTGKPNVVTRYGLECNRIAVFTSKNGAAVDYSSPSDYVFILKEDFDPSMTDGDTSNPKLIAAVKAYIQAELEYKRPVKKETLKSVLEQFMDFPEGAMYYDLYPRDKLDGLNVVFDLAKINGKEYIVIDVVALDKTDNETKVGYFHLPKDQFVDNNMFLNGYDENKALIAAAKEELARRKEAEENE